MTRLDCAEKRKAGDAGWVGAGGGGNGGILRGGGAMKRLRLVMVAMMAGTAIVAGSARVAEAREWKSARVVDRSETDVSGEMRGQKNTLHYTIETDDMIYFVNYSYKPSKHGQSGAPDIAVNVETKIAIEGRSAYILDVTGKEVKLHIVKKSKRWQ
jgi:hypothetical protein